jgi:putative DNA primase/helicase
MRVFPVPAGIDALTLLVDNDEPDDRGRRAGQEAAQECKERQEAAGREVTLLTPGIPGADFNDMMQP